jgi:hypothetical protein
VTAARRLESAASVKRALFLVVLLTAVLPASANAQARRYYIMAGATLNSLDPFDADVGTDTGPGLLLRGVPRSGLGPVVDLSGFELDLRRNPDERKLGALKLRAPMAGIGYTVERGRLATTLHAAVGWSFNKVETDRQVIERDGAQFEVKNRPLLRTGVTLTWSVGSRLALVSSAGVLFVDPKLTLAFKDGSQRTVRSETDTWRTNGLVWEVGVAYKVF